MSAQDIVTELRTGIRAAFSNIKTLQAQLGSNSTDLATVRQELLRQQQSMQNIADAIGSVRASGSGGGPLSQGDQKAKIGDHIMYISQIPGRRVPYDLLVQIAIGSDVRSVQPATATISQDGPFIAVARYATFQSTYSFTAGTGATTATFQGRSYGRFRPIHSVRDFNDAMLLNPITGGALPGDGRGIFASPTNHSNFRTMEFDGVIKLTSQGSGYPRMSDPVPTPFWVDADNGAFQLGSLDFFERGETLQFEVTPNHVHNPPAGNVQGFNSTNTIYPSINSQYDVHEGILDPLVEGATEDPVTRLPQGILTIGLHGFRIIQPPGPVRLA